MKTIKSKLFIFIILLSVTSLITSCTKESESNSTENAKVAPFLKSFYKKDFKLGKAVNTKVVNEISATSRSIDVENLVLTEVFVGEDTRARGYIITDKSTNEFLYFIDVDRIDYKLTSVKIDVNDTKVFESIDELDKYVITNQFDFIKIVEELNSVTTNGKFWGSQLSWGSCGPDSNGDGGCSRGQYSTYYVCWIATSAPIATGVVEACDCK